MWVGAPSVWQRVPKAVHPVRDIGMIWKVSFRSSSHKVQGLGDLPVVTGQGQARAVTAAVAPCTDGSQQGQRSPC